MTSAAEVRSKGDNVTIHVAMTFRHIGGRKRVVTPDGSDWTAPRNQIDSTLVKAIVKAYRWLEMLESGEYNSVHDLAKAEKVNHSYVWRIVRLTTLAPDIVQAIVEGRQPVSVNLQRLMQPFSANWPDQRAQLLK